MADPTDEFVIADGHRLRLRWFVSRRRPDADVIVLLHQGLGSVTQWRNFPQVLATATGCAVLGYDRWGHGGSDALSGPRDPDFLDAEARRALPGMLDAFGIAHPILYGHSDGGTIALLFAAAFAGRPRAVISEAAHVFSEVESARGLKAVVEEYRTGGLRARLARHHAHVDAMFDAWSEVWLSPAMRDWTMVDSLHAIRCPLLVIQGEDDDHGSPAQIAAIAARSGGPVETSLLPRVGHIPHLEATDAVAARVAAFLRPILSGA